MTTVNTLISVIVPAYNSADTLTLCLDALMTAKNISDFVEIWVVDDGSSDDTVTIVSRYDVSVLSLASNSGPAAARNVGAKHANGDILVFIDADVAVAPDALQRIANYFQHDDRIALIGSYDNDPKERDPISRYRNLLHHFVHQNAPTYATHFWTGLGAIRKSIFDSIGGFDEARFGRGCEDIEMGYRLRAQGYPIALDKNLQGKHLKHWTFKSMVYTDLFIRAIPWTQLLIQYQQMPNDFSLGLTQRISVTLAWLIPITLPMMFSMPILPLCTVLLFVIANWSFFRFLATHEGGLMSAACLPLHVLYHFISGLGFLIGMATALCPKCLKRFQPLLFL